jgi:hypothetical protein
MIFPPPSLSSSALVKLWLSLRNALFPLRPDNVHVSLSVQVRPRSSLTMIVSWTWTWTWNWYGAAYHGAVYDAQEDNGPDLVRTNV